MRSSSAPEFRGTTTIGRTQPSAPTRRTALLAGITLGCMATRRARADSPGSLERFSGAAPPTFILDRLGGGRASPSDVAGRVAIIHFFATYCEPCRAEMASLDRLVGRFDPAALAVLAVDVGEIETRVAAFLARHPVRYPVLLDRDRKVTRAWDIHVLPSTIILDRSQVPRFIARREIEWDREDVTAQLSALAGEAERKVRHTTHPS